MRNIINSICHPIATTVLVLLSTSLPGYSETTEPIHKSLTAESTDPHPINTPSDITPAEGNPASASPNSTPTEGKLALPTAPKAAAEKKPTETTKVRVSKNAKARRREKTLIQQMSSDDTTKEYATSIDPNLHFQRARELAANKNYNLALKEINKALIQNPKFYEAQYLGALIYSWQGRKQDAANKLKHILLEKPNYLQARISLGVILNQLGQDVASEAEYRKAIDTSFLSCEAHYNFANLLTKENRFKEALQELRICLKLAPDNAAAHNNMGVIYFHQHYVEESEKEFRQASELEPANETYVHNLELVRSGNKSLEAPSLG